ncbi:hypothetical protein psal_cds_861 [Pandoravirus salinus]|uniref:Uncharacterized protein n=1 Tax=Pandoravirus salinus TaxID=1349410 RepID=A0A291ATR2_9VIRU|nr:hypothetical protein psal_cds_861 [Pandoravirus salinus]ATE82244.1 hypothetical protein psal_cds_861 [Pandoravirus salinus]
MQRTKVRMCSEGRGSTAGRPGTASALGVASCVRVCPVAVIYTLVGPLYTQTGARQVDRTVESW